MFGRPRRLAILAEGAFAPFDAKTAIGMLRYRPEQVTVIIDSTRFGQTAEACVGVGGGVPVLANVEQAAACGADSLMIGIAPQGGGLPEAWRATLRDALSRGWDVLSGLHSFLNDDEEFAALAAEHGATIHDVRRPPPDLPVATGQAESVEALVVLTVGSDCNVGKMTTSLQIVEALKERQMRARFVATGQTGIFIADHGIAVDALAADFVAGAAEMLVLQAASHADIIVVEGQGALHHPSYSGVALGLLHGACPAAMVLCHAAGRERMHVTKRDDGGPRMPSLAEARRAYETAAGWVRSSRVAGIAINTELLDPVEARGACADASTWLGLPATDPVRFDVGPIAEALISIWKEMRDARLERSSRER